MQTKAKKFEQPQNIQKTVDLVVRSKRPAAMSLDLWQGDNVIMSNALVTSIHRLDMNGKRVVGLALSKIEQQKSAYLNETGEWCVELSSANFAETFQLEGSDVYLSMQRGVNELMHAHATMTTLDKETKRQKVVKMNWTSWSAYVEGQGKIKLAFSQHLTPHITRFVQESGGGYSLYKITQAGRLRSVYAWRLLEMFSSFRDTGWMSIDIDELHERLETAPSMRTNFGQFKLYCLNVVVQELREKCHLDVKFEATKEGRRYTKIKFSFRDDPEFVASIKMVENLPTEKTKTVAGDTSNDANTQSIWHASNLKNNQTSQKLEENENSNDPADSFFDDIPVD